MTLILLGLTVRSVGRSFADTLPVLVKNKLWILRAPVSESISDSSFILFCVREQFHCCVILQQVCQILGQPKKITIKTSPSTDMVGLGVQSSSRTQKKSKNVWIDSLKVYTKCQVSSTSMSIKYRYMFKPNNFFFKNACMDQCLCTKYVSSTSLN